MARYGTQFGPDTTFLGVPPCDWSDPATYAGAQVVVLGAPFDGGTSRRPGTRVGPQYIRQSCYLPHDGSRPSLALRVDGLRDLAVHDAVRRLAYELPLVGVDVVEVSPPYDHAEITSFLADRVVLEVLSGMARRRRDAADGTTWGRRPPLLDGR
ncbi:arginase family protein [Pseudonocardia sp. KRD-184]|uniref:Arginase family protein n=1 Tax=Pseudonocardia oceani TaxID=2792013 RepID=A0ABS6UAY7_9PSEU|nr:arginase family protein [Pseudonocardia oceani]MBW0092936.1 arginase family protein [Pseudonocardia oceani]MBW0097410.1 arginase family protein [Pseudonocardia oceani]MBW0112373.1 arginase family protein [Pseudonocardia oceani]MBW0124147.1 arginase family protein [Pseudonocardia oceani]MBW0129402.1 arginase family protein [Pseudonocardia oceani]